MALHSTLSQLPREAAVAPHRQLRHPRRPVRADQHREPGRRRQRGRGSSRVSPVAGARIITGLVPCNVIPDEILTDHPDRFRAMLVESGNPAHSLADSQRMREALGALDCVVVIDVAMTETARAAPTTCCRPRRSTRSGSATFFNFEFPENVFHLRRPLLDPLPGTLPEPEIHARLCEALGVLTDDDLAPLRRRGRAGPGRVRRRVLRGRRANGPSSAGSRRWCSTRRSARRCPTAARRPRPCCGAPATRAAQQYPESVRRAGFDGEGLEAGEPLFDAILSSPSGVDVHGRRVRRQLATAARPTTARCTSRCPSCSTSSPALAVRGAAGRRPGVPVRALRRRAPLVHRQHDLPRPGVAQERRRRRAAGQPGRRRRPAASSTATSCGSSPARGAVVAPVEVTDTMQPGHISLPNGLGLDHPGEDGRPVVRRGAERAHLERRPRLVRRHAVAQARAAPGSNQRPAEPCAAPGSTTGRARSPGPPT